MSISRLAYYLVLIGGILLVVFGGIRLLQESFRGIYAGWDFGLGGLPAIIAGIIAIMGASRAGNLVWAIVLIIVGAVVGGIGGLLILIGGILGLVNSLSHPSK